VAGLLDTLTSRLHDRYVVNREIGRGGMAVVYLARDLRHDRFVALKVLEPELALLLGTERFLREIRVAARLHHPNLLPVYDSGEVEGSLYYVVPYIEGGSVRHRLLENDPIPPATALRWVREAAEGLDFAHRNNVVHRDVKPENLLLEDDHAIVADFGIARAVSAAAQDRAAAALTQTGLLVGTPSYMSPEQADGGALDGRADVYSLGCVLYELLTRQPAFTGSSALEILAKRYTQPSPTLRAVGVTLPPVIEAVVDRALAKDPADRFQTARELADAIGLAESTLRRGEVTFSSGPVPGASPAVSTPGSVSLAVLPFVNMSADRDNEYFSDGLTEELINVFAKMAGVRVASRTSAFAFKAKDLDVREIGRRLGVTSVLEGSVRRAGTRVRVTAQLISVLDGCHLWSETYDREMADVFLLQDEVSRAIAGALKLRLMGEETLVKPPTVNPDAYTLYLKGRFFWYKRAPDALRKGVEYFNQAVGVDPGYALAYCGLADSYHILAMYGVLSGHEAYPMAKAMAARALELEPDLPDAHLSNAYVALAWDWNWAAAEAGFRRTIASNPTDAMAHHWLAWMLIVVKRWEEAAEAARRVVKLEPLSPFLAARSGHILSYAGQPAEGEVLCRRALELDPQFATAYEALAVCQVGMARYNEAAETLQRGADLPGSTSCFLLPMTLALAGRKAEARAALESLGCGPRAGRMPVGYAALFPAWAVAALGDLDEAFEWLEYGYRERLFTILLLDADPGYAPLRSDPRFLTLRRRLGLPG
jgi:serine/threonine-protein kinase